MAASCTAQLDLRLSTCPNPPIATITVNPAWNEGSACPVYLVTHTNYDFCTIADVALGTYFSGAQHVQEIGISTTGGVDGKVGSANINNDYAVWGVLSPEYVNDTLHHDGGKSGAVTGTTSGAITAEMWDVEADICMPEFVPCPTPKKTLLLQNVAEVHATSSQGDSGAPVFTNLPKGSAAPYAAMGILVGGEGAGNPCTGDLCHFVFARWDMIQMRLGRTLNPTLGFH